MLVNQPLFGVIYYFPFMSKEFFAKKKLQQKLQKLGVAPPASSAGDISNGSTDLLTLFVVNQIASTKTNQGKVTIKQP